MIPEVLLEMWEKDKELLRKSDLKVDINWNDPVPTNEYLFSVMVAIGKSWSNPANPVEVNDETVAEIASPLIALVEKQWGEKFKEQPRFKVVQPEGFLDHINKTERELIAELGYGQLLQSPPTMYSDQVRAEVVLPARYIVRKAGLDQRGRITNCVSQTFETEQYSWDKPYLEFIIGHELGHVMFRQLRGEWRQGYIDCMKAVGENNAKLIGRLSEAIAIHGTEDIARAVRPDLGGYAVHDKILDVWGNGTFRAIYLGVDSLATNQGMNYNQLAMHDFCMMEGNNVVAPLFGNHPHHADKLRKSNGE